MGSRACTGGSPADPWTPHVLHVGGVCAAGFSDDGRWLLVVTHSGRGVFDCRTLDRVARDQTEDYGLFDAVTEGVAGLGPLDGHRVRVAGFQGAIRTQQQLPVTTGDGWVVRRIDAGERLGGADASVFLRPPGSGASEDRLLGTFEPLYAVGFAPDGRTLIVAESHTILVLTRERAREPHERSE